MNADEALELARKAYPNDVDLRVAYMLGLNEGYELHREQMMKEAVEGYVSSTKGDHFGCVTSMPTDLGKLYCPDKVKLIIIKED